MLAERFSFFDIQFHRHRTLTSSRVYLRFIPTVFLLEMCLLSHSQIQSHVSFSLQSSSDSWPPRPAPHFVVSWAVKRIFSYAQTGGLSPRHVVVDHDGVQTSRNFTESCLLYNRPNIKPSSQGRTFSAGL
jgi:hypothetical protein